MIGLVLSNSFHPEEFLEKSGYIEVQTPFGKVKGTKGMIGDQEVVAFFRKGVNEEKPTSYIELPPLNQREIFAAMRQLGVHTAYGTTTAGSLDKKFPVGSFVILDQFIDFSVHSITYGGYYGSFNTDFTYPFCNKLRSHLIQACEWMNLPHSRTGTYVGTRAPRYETAAEIKMFQRLGGDLVGHTGVGDAIAAREAGICYAQISSVSNLAAGIDDENLSPVGIEDIKKDLEQVIVDILVHAITQQETCPGGTISCGQR